MDRTYSVAIVAACPFPYTRGTPIRVLRMAESLVARGHHVEVFTYHLGQAMEDLPFTIHRTPNLPTYHKFSAGPTYQKLFVLDTLLAASVFNALRSRRFDVIHAHHYEGLLASLPAARLLKLPVVFDVHTLLSSELPHYSMGLPKPWLHWIGERFDHALPPRADHIVAVTNTIRERLMDRIGIAGDRITTVYTGLESEYFHRGQAARQPAPPDTLIYAGNLEPYQGIDLMLKAFRLVLDRNPNVRLKIVSSSSLKPYEALIHQLGLEGQLDYSDVDYFHLPERLHSAAIALSPRVVCDGLPVKILNYMATGRAIVAFAGSAEVITDRETGLVVKDGDIAAFAEAILGLVERPEFARQLGQNAQSHVEEFFVWESAVKLLEDIYQKVLK